MAFSNMVSILRMHLLSYISVKGLLVLHNKKRLRCKKTEAQPDLFSDTRPKYIPPAFHF